MLRILLSSLFVLLLSFHSHNVLANSQTLDNCWELLNKKVQEDIISSFPVIKGLMEKDNGFSYKYKYIDLIKMEVPLGKEDSHLNSLIELFSGSSIGDRTLLIISEKYNKKWDNSFTGYLFYKEIDGTNVLLKLKRGTMKWKVVERSKIRGKYITFAQINKDCVNNH